MSRPVLLLLDPSGARRKLFGRVLRVDFDLLTPRGMKEAKRMLDAQQPDVVLASTQQPKGNGLALCTRLRKHPGGDCLMVVHGSPPEGEDADHLRMGIGTDFKVDHWLHNNASPALVALTLKQLLRAHHSTRKRRRRPMAPPLSITPEADSTPSERRRASDAKLRTTGQFEVEFKRPAKARRGS